MTTALGLSSHALVLIHCGGFALLSNRTAINKGSELWDS